MAKIRLDFKAMNEFSRAAKAAGQADPVKAIAARVSEMKADDVDQALREFGTIEVNIASAQEQLEGKNEIYVLRSPGHIYIQG